MQECKQKMDKRDNDFIRGASEYKNYVDYRMSARSTTAKEEQNYLRTQMESLIAGSAARKDGPEELVHQAQSMRAQLDRACESGNVEQARLVSNMLAMYYYALQTGDSPYSKRASNVMKANRVRNNVWTAITQDLSHRPRSAFDHLAAAFCRLAEGDVSQALSKAPSDFKVSGSEPKNGFNAKDYPNSPAGIAKTSEVIHLLEKLGEDDLTNLIGNVQKNESTALKGEELRVAKKMFVKRHDESMAKDENLGPQQPPTIGGPSR
jgi:hypothetical protein